MDRKTFSLKFVRTTTIFHLEIDVEKKGKDNAGFTEEMSENPGGTKVEEEKVDEKTQAENDKRAAEGM